MTRMRPSVGACFCMQLPEASVAAVGGRSSSCAARRAAGCRSCRVPSSAPQRRCSSRTTTPRRIGPCASCVAKIEFVRWLSQRGRTGSPRRLPGGLYASALRNAFSTSNDVVRSGVASAKSRGRRPQRPSRPVWRPRERPDLVADDRRRLAQERPRLRERRPERARARAAARASAGPAWSANAFACASARSCRAAPPAAAQDRRCRFASWFAKRPKTSFELSTNVASWSSLRRERVGEQPKLWIERRRFWRRCAASARDASQRRARSARSGGSLREVAAVALAGRSPRRRAASAGRCACRRRARRGSRRGSRPAACCETGTV